MKNIAYIFLIFILSGCSSAKNTQSESTNINSMTDIRKNQFTVFFKSIEKKGTLKPINKYRLAILDKTSFDSDTIIYYEHNTAPDMIMGRVDYRCNLYESKDDSYYSYMKINVEPNRLSPDIKNPLSLESITKLEVETAPLSGSFKNIVRTIKKSSWEKTIKKRKDRGLTGVRDYGNTLVVAIKVGEGYQFKSYNDITFEPNAYIEVEPLEIITNGYNID